MMMMMMMMWLWSRSGMMQLGFAAGWHGLARLGLPWFGLAWPAFPRLGWTFFWLCLACDLNVKLLCDSTPWLKRPAQALPRQRASKPIQVAEPSPKHVNPKT